MSINVYKALYQIQGKLRGVQKDAKNPHFKNNYATLEQVEDTIRPHMQEHGLVWMQFPGRVTDGGIEVKTVIVHAETGDSISGTMEVPLGKRDPQGAGSALTYGQRYSLMAILGLPPTDDDAETAIDRSNSRPEPETPVKSSAALKREGSWEKIREELANEMLDVKTLVRFESVKNAYRKKAKEHGWNEAFMFQLRDMFDSYEQQLMDAAAVNDTNERVMQPLMAGE